MRSGRQEQSDPRRNRRRLGSPMTGVTQRRKSRHCPDAADGARERTGVRAGTRSNATLLRDDASVGASARRRGGNGRKGACGTPEHHHPRPPARPPLLCLPPPHPALVASSRSTRESLRFSHAPRSARPCAATAARWAVCGGCYRRCRRHAGAREPRACQSQSLELTEQDGEVMMITSICPRSKNDSLPIKRCVQASIHCFGTLF